MLRTDISIGAIASVSDLLDNGSDLARHEPTEERVHHHTTLVQRFRERCQPIPEVVMVSDPREGTTSPATVIERTPVSLPGWMAS